MLTCNVDQIEKNLPEEESSSRLPHERFKKRPTKRVFRRRVRSLGMSISPLGWLRLSVVILTKGWEPAEGGAPGAMRVRIDVNSVHLEIRTKYGPPATLTGTEFRLINLLLLELSGTKGVDRERLRDVIWRNCHVGQDALKVHLCNLRAKLLPTGLDIVFNKGRGGYHLARAQVAPLG